jgi:hypothetical protein
MNETATNQFAEALLFLVRKFGSEKSVQTRAVDAEAMPKKEFRLQLGLLAHRWEEAPCLT